MLCFIVILHISYCLDMLIFFGVTTTALVKFCYMFKNTTKQNTYYVSY